MEPPQDEEDRVVITAEYLKELCEQQGQYITPRLNNQLFLNGKGFTRIEALEEYTELEALWLQSNSISKIEGLSQMPYLKLLYLQNNMIETIENLQPFKYLVRLDLSGNRIHKIEGLSGLYKLQDLMLEDNLLSRAEDVRGILEVQGSLCFLNLAKNKLKGVQELIPLFGSMDKLISVDLRHNPGVQEMSQYRKRFIGSLRRLGYLDGSKIEELERVTADAFVRGGRTEEQEARQQYQQKKEETHKKEIEERKSRDVVVEARVKRTLEKYRNEGADAWKALLSRRLQLLSRKVSFSSLGLERKKPDKRRTFLKLIAVEKDIRRMREEQPQLATEESLILKYADMAISDYIEAIKPPQDYQELVQAINTQQHELAGKLAQAQLQTSELKEDTAPAVLQLVDNKLSPVDPPVESTSIPPLESVPFPVSGHPSAPVSASASVSAPAPVSAPAAPFVWTEEAEQQMRKLVVGHAFNFANAYNDFVALWPTCNLTIAELRAKFTAGDQSHAHSSIIP